MERRHVSLTTETGRGIPGERVSRKVAVPRGKASASCGRLGQVQSHSEASGAILSRSEPLRRTSEPFSGAQNDFEGLQSHSEILRVAPGNLRMILSR